MIGWEELRVGEVEACSASEIKVDLSETAPQSTALNNGNLVRFPRLNGYVLIPNQVGAIVGQITRLTIEPARERPEKIHNEERVKLPTSRRRLYLSPIGTVESTVVSAYETQLRMRRGVEAFPTVGDSVILPTSDQLSAIVEAFGEDRRLWLGTAPYAHDADVTVDPDKIFGRHLAIFGNTGSGKSCTVSGLVRWSIESAAENSSDGYVRGNFIILDSNGEYAECFDDLQRFIDVKHFRVQAPTSKEQQGKGVEPLTVPAWIWTAEEWASLLRASPGVQQPVLFGALRHMKTGHDGGRGYDQAFAANMVKAYTRYFSGKLEAGPDEFARFPRFKDIHEQVETFAEWLQERSTESGWEDIAEPLQSSAEELRHVSLKKRYQDKYQALSIDDMQIVLKALRDLQSYLPEVAEERGGVGEDRPVRFDVRELPGTLRLQANLHGGSAPEHTSGLLLRLQSLLSDERIQSVIAPHDDVNSISEWLKKMLGDPSGSQGQVSIIDLSLVPSEVLALIISVFARVCFEANQRAKDTFGASSPTALILEEAHNFVHRPEYGSSVEAVSSQRCREIFEKIAKEGRKFGTGLVLSSQRPAELSDTVVAQCNSFILHRLVNDRDQDKVKRLVPDNVASLLGELPSLPQQRAVILGIATEAPVLVELRSLSEKYRPSSSNPPFWDHWSGSRITGLTYEGLEEQWK